MISSQRKLSSEESKEHRLALGFWLRELREERGLSQRDLSEMLGLDYYTFISQLENGRGKIPSSRYREWAQALGQDSKTFVRKLLMHYDPTSYEILFSDDMDETY
ncbi:helix-turn-helix domain-containing protein [Roseovarius sp. D0-M9]|uniref:helix-turn-helix domain-containing protein n=1 Tax=Roseovarius sp. D0-M9 TaxID=3127117 RepID=UPI00301011CF